MFEIVVKLLNDVAVLKVCARMNYSKLVRSSQNDEPKLQSKTNDS